LTPEVPSIARRSASQQPEPDLDWLTSSLASDACGGRGVFAAAIRPLVAGQRIAGRVSTATVSEDDNLFIRRATKLGPTDGTILVAGGAALSHSSCMGGLVAAALVKAGFVAVVTDGLVRDMVELAEMPLQVWCRGTTPRAGAKNGPGSNGLPTGCAGVLVSPGDFVVADDDGVVVWPANDVTDLLAAAREKARRDEEAERRIESGGGLDGPV
jgi:regulator of RNase E activity RraA